jgi:hypothetical protein
VAENGSDDNGSATSETVVDDVDNDDDADDDNDDDDYEEEEEEDADAAGRRMRSQKSQYEMVVLPHQRSGPPQSTGSLKQPEPFAGHRSDSKS